MLSTQESFKKNVLALLGKSKPLIIFSDFKKSLFVFLKVTHHNKFFLLIIC